MKKHRMLVIAGLSLALSACSSMNEQQPLDVAKEKPASDPVNVSLYPTGAQPLHPYQVLGEGRVSKYNHGGIKRQIAYIHDKIRDIAASMGGDAVINLKDDKKIVTGTVVRYDKNLA